VSYSEPARTAARRTRSPILAALVVVSAAFLGVLLHQSLASSSHSIAPPIALLHGDSFPQAPAEDLRWDDDHVGQRDGAVPDGVSVFDDDVPAVAKLDPALLRALRRAANDAADDAVEFVVDSGWRSPEYQERLLREAIAKYGSEKEAARWVATPATSAHVSGDAVDLGPVSATAWLSKHGAEYGLCQIYRNEPWHYELRPEAIGHSCPRMYADPTHDPRMN
jgi:zinc D-Ala-D-Ala carboxypeptidase